MQKKIKDQSKVFHAFGHCRRKKGFVFFVYANLGHCSFRFLSNNNLYFCKSNLSFNVEILSNISHIQEYANQNKS
jgi:hypothetical protein